MKRDELQSETINLQWNFFERAINNYSIIMKIMSNVEDDMLVNNIPKVFVEESFFDMCKIMIDDEGVIRQGFYSIDNTLGDIDFTAISMLNSGASAPSVVEDSFGYGILYVYPLKKDLKIIGYLVLGKRYYMDMDMRLLRELEIVCDIYNKSLLLSNSKRHREVRSKAALEITLEEFPDALLLIDKNGFICYANKKGKGEFETEKGLLIGEKIDRIVPGIMENIVGKTDVILGEIKYKRGNAFKIFKVESFPVQNDRENGQWRGIVFRDVMEKRIQEEEDLLKQKMKSVGMLAGGVAHDFNNMLTGILGYASLMKKLLAGNDKLSRYAESIEQSAQRASNLTQHLLNFSRRQKKSTGIVHVNTLLEDVLFLLKESFREIKIVKSFDEALVPTKGDEAGLQNVFLNLFINAKDAMGGKGLLQVETRRDKQGHGKDYIIIEIKDTGEGIDEELKGKIFEPYFSTKEGDSNLGMGLYLVERVIKEHGGFIEVESEKEKGTKFTIYLPVPAAVSVKKIKGETKATKDILKGKTILIVDDEDMIRELARGVLADTGLNILEAPGGLEAVEIYSKQHDKIDIVLLDVVMPGLKGDEVLKRIRQIKEDARVIVSSGYMNEEQRGKLKAHSVNAFLDKPYKDTDVVETTIKVLSE